MSADAAWEHPAAGRRRRAVLVAFGVAATILGGHLGRGGPAEPHLEVRDAPHAAPDPRHEAAGRAAAGDDGLGRWRTLASPPIVRRTEHSAVWTGDEVITWGGVRTDPRPHTAAPTFLRDGAAYHTRRDAWRRLPRAPVPARHGHLAAWTGREMLIWGSPAAGAAYNPRTDRWRMLPDGPLDTSPETDGGWTGQALVVWTIGEAPTAAAYWPDQDVWTLLPPVPVAPGQAWQALAVTDGLLVGTPTARHRWHRLDLPGGAWVTLSGPAVPAAGPDAQLVWTGTAVAAWRDRVLVSYEPDTGAVTRLPAPPVPSGEATLVAAGSRLVLWDGAGGHVLLAGADRWERLASPPLEHRDGAVVQWAGDRLVVWGGASAARHFADGAVLRLPPYGSGSRVTTG